MIDVYRELSARLERGDGCATATVVSASGSIPNEVGATMLVDARGELVAGTIGGGEIEHRALAECRAALAEGKARSFTYALTEKEAGGIGMMCGGSAQIFVQVHRPAPQLVLIGGGHISVELYQFAARFDFAITVIEDRPEWCSEGLYPRARRLQLQPAEGIEAIDFHRETYVVVATRDRDTPALAALASKTCGYVGVVASKRKALRLLQTLEGEGVSTEQLCEVLRAPVGLDLGGRSPADVALSILAQIQAIRHRRSAADLALPSDKLRQHRKR